MDALSDPSNNSIFLSLQFTEGKRSLSFSASSGVRPCFMAMATSDSSLCFLAIARASSSVNLDGSG